MKTICVDFDRVIHEYTTPWSGPDIIEDRPVKGAFEWLAEMVEYYEVCIYSARSSTSSGRQAMTAWFRAHGLSEAVAVKLHFPSHKPSAVLYIDDRAFHFQGTFPMKEFIDNFVPWHPQRAETDRPRGNLDAFLDLSPVSAGRRIVDALPDNITGRLILADLRHEALAHLDVDARAESISRELVGVVTCDGAEPLLHYSTEVAMPDGRVFRVVVNRL